jgi:Zn-dependent metalloprotease
MKRLVLPVLAAALAGSAVLASAASAAPTRTVVRDITSATGRHVWYQWQVGGLDLYHGIQVVNTLPAGRTQSTAPARADLALAGAFRLDARGAQAAAEAAVNAGAGAQATASKVAFAQGSAARRAWLVRVDLANAPGEYEVVVDAESGAVLSQRNTAETVDGTGQVFEPNPVVELGRIVQDHHDRNFAAIRNTYHLVTLHDLDGSGHLRGPWVDTTFRDRPSTAFEPSEQFIYTRDDNRFEAVMVYYYLDRTQSFIQSLGFGTVLPGVNMEQQEVQVDHFRFDNSFYSPNHDRISYGTGGVDDAEDPEVILHEYGHAIQDAEVPGWGATEEGGAMGEGFGDYWAVDQTYDATVADGGDVGCIADWDSVSYSPPPDCLRRIDGTKHYPEDVVGEVHADGEMWSASLWQIRMAVGQAVADRDILESHFLLSPTAQFADGAQALIDADQALYGGAHVDVIRSVMHARGFI